MDRQSARHLMLRVHSEGTAECGIYPYEMAKAKATQVVDFAREHQYPLKCLIERKQWVRVITSTKTAWPHRDASKGAPVSGCGGGFR